MAQSWRTVRVFISSTFRDMHTERDWLVRVVFPELKERCRKRHVNLIDVDLRWGVTEKQAEEGGALDICLDEIDTCRPYFLGLLGQRYGSLPAGNEHSITAEEIFHGVLHNDIPRQVLDLRPFVEGILEGKTLLKEQVSCLVRNYQWNADKRKYLLKQNVTPEDESTLRSIFKAYSIYQKDRSFFFFRAESLTRKLAGNNIHDYFETNDTLKGKLETLKQEIKDKLPWSEYEDIETFGQKVLETLWKRIDAEFPESRQEVQRDWLKEEAAFHELFIADRTRRFVGRLDFLKTMHSFTENDTEPKLMVITGESGCGKSALMARFTEEVIHNHPDWLILSHFVGASPSSSNIRQTLKRFCTEIFQSCQLDIQKQEKLRSIIGTDKKAIKQREAVEKEFSIPEEYQQLTYTFNNFVEKAAVSRQIMIIIDALNQLERTDNAHTLRWLPQKLPDNVKVVVSALAGDILEALKSWHIQPRFEELTGLKKEEIKDYVTAYLEEIDKKFPNPQIEEVFYNKIKAGNPLYIAVALEELRIFPLFEHVAERVNSLPDTVPELFDQVLERIESDFSRPLVQDFTSSIACGRQGMTGEELQTLLKKHATIIDPDIPPTKYLDMLFARLRRAFSAYLFERSGVIDFFHTQLKEAVGKRYLAEETDRDKVHQTIADYFEKRWNEPYLRALDELPHQLIKGKSWDGLERILCDLKFIEAKCANGMTYELIRDYHMTLDSLPEAQPDKQERLKHEARVKKYTEDLIAYARGEIDHLDIIPSAEPWSDEKIRWETQRIISNPTRLDKINAFSQFVNSDSHGLVKYAFHPGFVIQQAYNSACSGPVATAAKEMIDAGLDNILFLQHSSRLKGYNPYPSLLKILKGHTNQTKSVKVTADGRIAISGSDDHTLRVWDLESGICLRTILGQIDWFTKVNLTLDGKIAISTSKDKTLRVWDLENGICLKTVTGEANWFTRMNLTPDCNTVISISEDKAVMFETLENDMFLSTLNENEHEKNIISLSLTADGKMAISGSVDGTLRIWDVKNGKCLKTLEGGTFWAACVSVTSDGKIAVSGSMEGTLYIWDLQGRESPTTIERHKEMVSSVMLTPDGEKAVSGSWDETLRVWDLESGKCLRTFQGHTNWIETVVITPDGEKVISGSMDNTLRVWDLVSGKCLRILKGNKWMVRSKDERTWDIPPTHPARFFTITPDNKLIISECEYDTLLIWDLESGKCLGNIHVNEYLFQFTGIHIAPDGKIVISMCNDSELDVWDLDSGKYLSCISSKSLVKNNNMTLNGKENGNVLGEGYNHSIECVAFTPDEKRVITGNADKTLRVWDLESGKCLKVLKGTTSKVGSVRITPEGKNAISSNDDGTFQLWDLKNGECLRTFTGYSGRTENVSLIPGCKLAFSKSQDHTLRLWDLASGECLAIYYIESGVGTMPEISKNSNIVFGSNMAVVILTLSCGLSIKHLPVTPVRLRLHKNSNRWLFPEKRNGGHWDNRITVACPWCSQRFSISEKILDVISTINHNAHLYPDQSPCLELPDEAWEEPKLLSECPFCHKPLKFNPFIVDNRGRY